MVQKAHRSLSTQLSGAQVGISITTLATGFLAYRGPAETVVPPWLWTVEAVLVSYPVLWLRALPSRPLPPGLLLPPRVLPLLRSRPERQWNIRTGRTWTMPIP